MEQINKLIKERLVKEENINNTNSNNILNTQLSESIINSPSKDQSILNQYFKYTDINPNLNQNLNVNSNNKYRRQLIMAKIVISELQDNISNILLEKQQIESQLNEALNSIKSLHNDYISLTEKFSIVNKNINLDQNINDNKENKIINLEKKIKEIEDEKNLFKSKNEELELKLNNSNEMNKIQEDKYNYKILLLNKKIEKLEYELKEQNIKILNDFDIKKFDEEKKKLKEENTSLREQNIELNNKYNDDKKKLLLDIEKYKSKINLLESQNFNITTELKEKAILLEKEMRINEQYNTLDKHFNNSLQEKNISYNTLNDQYIKLFKEFNEYKNKNEKEKEENNNKYNKLNNEYHKLNNLIEEYKHKINMLKNKIKELKNNNNNNNYDNDRDINFKKNNNNNNNNNDLKNKNIKNNYKENDIRNNKYNDNNNISILEEKIYYLTKQKEYILSLLLKITPNKKLIQQIIDLNLEILQLEKQKESIVDKIKENPNLNIILPKIDEKISTFKNHLMSLEEELISIDFGSSRIVENSIQM